METVVDPIAEARRIYLAFQDEKLDETPLARVGDWLKSGCAPPAADLRSAGFHRDAPRELTSLARKAFIRRWGFAIPCAEVVDEVSKLSPIVEIGAGSAGWTALFRAAGIDAIATDAVSEGTPGYGLTAALHHPVEALRGKDAVERYSERNVFCSWPTHDDDWCSEAAKAIKRGRFLGLIGKVRGGSTGNDALFDVLERDFAFVACVEIPQFPGVDDRFEIFQRI
jgi:hypothetical protein